MKKLKTLSIAFVGALLLLAAGPLRPAFAGFVSLSSSTIVAVSSQTASPTTLLPAQQGSASHVEIWCHKFANDGEFITIQSVSTGFSLSASTGTARLYCPAVTANRSPLILENYVGPIYSVNGSTYTLPTNVMRVK